MTPHLIGTFLRDNWLLFTEINGMAGREALLDPIMVFGANDLIFLLPLLLLGLWAARARWAPWVRASVVGARASRDEPARRLSQQMALLGCAAVVLTVAISTTLGSALYEPRPFVSHPGMVHLLISHPADASFPSDHIAVASAIASILVLYVVLAAWTWRRQPTAAAQPMAESGRWPLAMPALLALLGMLAVAVMGVARVYVGVHYPADIVGGLGCGMLAALLLTALRPWLQPVLDVCLRLAERLHLA